MHCELIELLAPAKDLQTGIEAIKHGADAVYIGAPKFGARAAAGNSVEDIGQLVEFARPYGVKVYVTLNTILYDNELDEAQRLIDELANAGVDALIVQDMALIGLEQRIPLHASTQMDNRTAEKVAWLRDLGFEQVVLARELTLDEIREIHEWVPDVRLEVFVHGAICVSYNGQCYASQHCFGRSANRGECAQFCRMPFDLIEEQGAGGKEQGRGKEQGAGSKERIVVRQKHLLSLRDMNRSEDLEALLDAGASSLKIEGRLKDVAYVKNVVAYYRQRLDEIFRRRPEYRRSSLGHETIAFTPNPAKSFNRLFTDYFLHGRTPDMANIHTPKSMGEPLVIHNSQCIIHNSCSANCESVAPSGRPITQCIIQNNQCIIQNSQLHNGDGLCYINKEGELVGFRVNRVDGNRIYLADGSTFPTTGEMRNGLYRNHDQEFEQLLAKPTATRKVGVRWLLRETAEGFLLRLTREDGATVEQVFPYPHEPARSSQTEPITRQLSRLGDTPYEATGVDIEMSQEWFIPGSVLAEWRRCMSEDLRVKSDESKFPQALSMSGEATTLAPHPPLASRISYLGNVANQVARQFYLDHGAKRVDWALEVEQPKRTDVKGLLIMTCRYCIRYELGMCRRMKNEELRMKNGGGNEERRMKNDGELFLRLADGRRFRLQFDCRRCQMMVYAI